MPRENKKSRYQHTSKALAAIESLAAAEIYVKMLKFSEKNCVESMLIRIVFS